MVHGQHLSATRIYSYMQQVWKKSLDVACTKTQNQKYVGIQLMTSWSSDEITV